MGYNQKLDDSGVVTPVDLYPDHDILLDAFWEGRGINYDIVDREDWAMDEQEVQRLAEA